MESLRSSRSSDIMRQSKSIDIPIYKAKVETAEGKMDRISKYIASLKSKLSPTQKASRPTPKLQAGSGA
jgi:predicted translin family RNA/ssDNA-binding protein